MRGQHDERHHDPALDVTDGFSAAFLGVGTIAVVGAVLAALTLGTTWQRATVGEVELNAVR